jgi:hypothetical protein
MLTDPVMAQQLPQAGTPLSPEEVQDIEQTSTVVVDCQVQGGPKCRASYQEILNPDSAFYRKTQSFVPSDPKLKAIYNAARGVGIRAGFADEADRINKVVRSRYRAPLTSRFDFRKLMIEKYVIPPVITEIRNVREHSGSDLLYLTDGAFEIVKDARLSFEPPKWEEYLILPIQPPAAPRGLSVETPEEKDIWREGAKTGWYAGIVEARRGFVTGWNILNRDFGGMRRYHKLAQQGVVSLPDVKTVARRWSVSDNGTRAYKGETTIKLAVSPRFRVRN